jgi:hypothetical protein
MHFFVEFIDKKLEKCDEVDDDVYTLIIIYVIFYRNYT